jgi:uncharacterized protein (TIGR01244 family)
MFRKVTETLYASPQIGLEDVERAREMGVRLIINNRPEGESDDQTPGEAIASAARDAGIDYTAIPVTHAGFSHAQLDAFNAALDRVASGGETPGKVLAYCRSGTRSTLLWALARAKAGERPETLAAAASAAGYDTASVRAMMDALAGA